MPRMSLARVWRRQLLGASSVALMVPAAMLAAVVALDLGGGFSQVGLLGQIFAGPPVPGPFEFGLLGGAAPVSSGAPTRAGGGIGGAAPIVTQAAGSAADVVLGSGGKPPPSVLP